VVDFIPRYPGLSDAEAAATEADEEAGVKGRVDMEAFASFEYIKYLGDLKVLINARVFLLRVKKTEVRLQGAQGTQAQMAERREGCRQAGWRRPPFAGQALR